MTADARDRRPVAPSRAVAWLERRTRASALLIGACLHVRIPVEAADTSTSAGSPSSCS